MIPSRDPLAELLSRSEDAVLAFIAGTEGPSYRDAGSMMAIFSLEDRVGTLSSGCVEADISRHAMECLANGSTRLLRYGQGSPYRDIELPCGGGLDVLLIPRPDRDTLTHALTRRDAREACVLRIDRENGEMDVADATEQAATHFDGAALSVPFMPKLRFLIFGKGMEATTFAGLVDASGYPSLLASQDEETLRAVASLNCETRRLLSPNTAELIDADERTAIVLFFHDHEWEPPILARALETPAFYIGAQGSRRARDARHAAMQELGASSEAMERLHGPIGLIPSARDPETLAVSVLAEILANSMTRRDGAAS